MGCHFFTFSFLLTVQVLVHSPHRRVGLATGRVVPSDANKELALLNINQSVLSLCAGNLNVTEERDTLVVGTPTNLLAYDVENNTDIFYKEAGCITFIT